MHHEQQAVRIVCPACEKGTLAPASATDRDVRCAACAARYPLDAGVIELLPGAFQGRSIAQMLMEWPPLVRIYESRLWRRSLILTALTRISFEHEYSVITTAAHLDGAKQVLDLACGPGIYARRFARERGIETVVGLDLSLPMLRYAAERVRVEGLKNLILIHGNAMELPFEAGAFDVVNCCGALPLFPDAPRVLSEIHRVLKPGGRFTVAAFRRGETRLAERRAALRHRLYGISAFTPDDLSVQFQQAGFASAQCLHAAGAWLIMSAQAAPTSSVTL